MKSNLYLGTASYDEWMDFPRFDYIRLIYASNKLEAMEKFKKHVKAIDFKRLPCDIEISRPII